MSLPTASPAAPKKKYSPESFLSFGLPLCVSLGLFYYLILAIGSNASRKSAGLSIVAGTAEDYGWTAVRQDGFPGPDATLNYPTGIAVDPAGNLYIADSRNDLIRKITTKGRIYRIAGTGNPGFSGDHRRRAKAARLNRPNDLALDESGNLYIADTENNRIRKWSPGGDLITIAGGGKPGVPNSAHDPLKVSLRFPMDVVFDARKNLYIADTWNHCIRKVIPGGTITTVAGTGHQGFSGDGGLAIKAKLSAPEAIAVDLKGDLFIADTDNQRIRKVTPDGIIRTIAGEPPTGRWAQFCRRFTIGDGQPALHANLNHPHDLAVDEAGNLYIGDRGNSRIRRITPAGKIDTVVGRVRWFRIDFWNSYDLGSFWLDDPHGIAIDARGNLFITEEKGCQIWRAAKKAAPGLLAGRPIKLVKFRH